MPYLIFTDCQIFNDFAGSLETRARRLNVIATLVPRLQAVSADLKAKLDTQAAEHGRSTVARDLELEALRQNEEKMRLEITQRKEDIDRSDLTQMLSSHLVHFGYNNPPGAWGGTPI